MLILIVEDNRFNAFCLSRLLKTFAPGVDVQITTNANTAMTMVNETSYDAIIIDGNLGEAIDGNGPALASKIWSKYPWAVIVAWSDSATMRKAFAKEFLRYNKPFDDNFIWSKVVGEQQIRSLCRYCSHALHTQRPFEYQNYL